MQKMGYEPEPFIGNGGRGYYHGLTATAVPLREAGYFYVTEIVIYDVATFFKMHYRACSQSAAFSAGVLLLQRFQFARIRNVHTTKFSFVFIKTRTANPVFAVHLCSRCSRLLVFNHPYYLLI